MEVEAQEEEVEDLMNTMEELDKETEEIMTSETKVNGGLFSA